MVYKGLFLLSFALLLWHPSAHSSNWSSLKSRLENSYENICSEQMGSPRYSLEKIKRMSRVVTNGVGAGIEVDGVFTEGVGARVFGTLEVLRIGGKVTIACSYGAGVTFGASIGAAASIVGIKTFGCKKPSDYDGVFISAGLTGSIAPVEIGASLNIGLNLTQARSLRIVRQLENQFSEFKRKGALRSEVVRAFKKMINDYLEQYPIYLDSKTDFTLKTLAPIILKGRFSSNQFRDFRQNYIDELGRSLEKDYSRSVARRYAVLKTLSLFFSGCNSLNVEVGAAAKEGLSGAASMSFYGIIDSSFNSTAVLTRAISLSQTLMVGVCDRRLDRRLLTEALWSDGSIYDAGNFLLNLAFSPYTCNPLRVVLNPFF